MVWFMTALEFPAVALVDDVVLIRPWRSVDVPQKMVAFADPVVQRFSWSRTTPHTEADAREHFIEQDEARRRGVATHTVRLLAGWGFSALGLARIELTCGPDNLASRRVAERCGFVREGVLRSHLVFKGARRDSVMLSLLPGELR